MVNLVVNPIGHVGVREVKRFLKARGWTQAELARRCGVSKVMVTRLLKRQVVSRPLWHKITELLRGDGDAP